MNAGSWVFQQPATTEAANAAKEREMLLQSQRRKALALAAGTVMTLTAAQFALAGQSVRIVESRFNLQTGVANAVPGVTAAEAAAAATAGTYIQWFNGAVGQSPALTTAASIDQFGNVAYYGKMAVLTGAPPTLSPIISASNQLAIFYAPHYNYNADWMVARDGTPSSGVPSGGPTPSNPNNWVLNNLSATPGNGLAAGVGMSSNGRMLITGQLRDPVTLANSTNTNNTAFFTGFANSLAETARRSDAAPGTTLANYNTSLNFSPINSQVNPNGQVFFSSALTSAGAGTDVVTSGLTQNDSAAFIEGPSGSSLVARRGDSPAFLSGAAFGALTTNPGSQTINANGDVLFGHTLSTTQGTTPATTSNDTVIVAKVGSSLQLVAREGGAVTVNGNPETYLAGQSLSNGLSSLGQTWNNNGRAIYGAKFTPSANITAGSNDLGIMSWQGGVSNVVVQSGLTVVPHSFGSGTLSDLGSLSNSQTRINNNDNFVFSGVLATGGTITTANDAGLWYASATNSNPTQLIVQEGMSAPGFGAATFGSGFFGVVTNNADMVVFQNTLSNGVASLWGWGASFGLINLTFNGDTSILGANYPVSNFNYLSTGNGNGGVYSFNDNGDLVLTIGSAGIGGAFGSNGAIVVINVPAPAVGSLALLGLGAFASRRRRA